MNVVISQLSDEIATLLMRSEVLKRLQIGGVQNWENYLPAMEEGEEFQMEDFKAQAEAMIKSYNLQEVEYEIQ